MTIPLVDLAVQHEQIAEEVFAGWKAATEGSAYVLSDDVAHFEKEFAVFSGVAHCIGVANGTDAIELALRAVGIGAGDEVLVPANTFVATPLAVLRAGATPLLVDVDPMTLLMDPDDLARRITPATTAVVPVHLFGQLAPLEAIAEVLAERDIAIVEDAAQAHGATRHGAGPGSIGLAASTSFYPGKNLGAYGDAGAVLTASDEIAASLRRLRNYGSDQKYEHPTVGFNSRLDGLQAVVLRAKLARLAAWNDQRRAAAATYDALLADVDGVTLPVVAPGNEHVWHLYVVRVPERDRVLGELHDAGIGAAVHYPSPVHLHGAFAGLGRPGDFPVAEVAATQILSLPLYPGITEDQQEQVAVALRKAMR